jgi:hypothetical protein
MLAVVAVQVHQAAVQVEQAVVVLEVQELLLQELSIEAAVVVLVLGLEQPVAQELLLLDTQQHKKQEKIN